MNKEQICYKCRERKKEIEFAKNSSYCKLCHSVYMREWRKKNYERAKEISQSWKKNNPERAKAYYKSWYRKNKNRRKIYYPTTPEKQKEYSLKHYYGLTLNDVNKILERQKGRCSICENIILKNNLRIDHDHKTKKVRGLLCNNCNIGIGFFCENIKFLYSAIKYLKTYNHKS